MEFKMSQGFIQLHRKIQEEWFWNDSKLSHLMIDLILRANHEAKEVSFKGEKRTINRGETITTYRDLGQELGYSKSTIGRSIKKLIKGGELEIIPTKATHIIVVKYDYYLNDDFSPQIGNAWEKDGTKESLNNNYNNENTTHNIADRKSAEVSYDEMIEDEEFMNDLKKKFFFVTKNIDDELYTMLAHYEENGNSPRNWKAAFKKWLMRLKKFRREDEIKELAKANLES